MPAPTKVAVFTLAEVAVHVWHDPGEGYIGILSERRPEPSDPAFSTPLAAVVHHFGAAGALASIRWIDASHAPQVEIVPPNSECIADPRHRQFSRPSESPVCMVCRSGMRWIDAGH